MFGYVKTRPAELRGRESEYYKGVYCGLCRAQGKCTGQCSRMTLSYDFVFMALVRMALTQETPTFSRRRCIAHPLRRRTMARPTPAMYMTALSSALLTYYKVMDDRADEKGLRHLRACVLTPPVAGARRRAIARGIDGQKPASWRRATVTDGRLLDTRVAECMKGLAATEAERPASVDQPAERFGQLMGDMMAYGLEGKNARLAREIGRHTGRWVYILDAADDYAEDVRRGRYNPFVCLYGECPPTLPEERRQEIRTALLCELEAIADAMDLMEITDRNLDGVLHNILYEGMPHTVTAVLWGEGQAPTQDPRENTTTKG